VKANRKRHTERMDEALSAFWKKALMFAKLLEQRAFAGSKELLRPVTRHHDPRVPVRIGGEEMPIPPQSHVSDYDCALDMLEMHQGNIIELRQNDFQMLVRDKWHWREEFMGSYRSLTG